MSYDEVRQTESKKDFVCQCGKQVKKGNPCVVDPKTRTAWCLSCKRSSKKENYGAGK